MESEVKKLQALLDAACRAQRAAEQARKAAEQALDAEKRQTRNTTLPEYLEACHAHLFARSVVEEHKSRTTQGTMTKPDGKRCPTRLREWTDFHVSLQTELDRLWSSFPSQVERRFECISFIIGLGNRIAMRKIGSEKDLEFVQHECVELPVAHIINNLQHINELNLGAGISFENHLNALSNAAEEPSDKHTARNTVSKTPARLSARKLRVDQACVFTKGDSNQKSLVFIVEYKAPHKLTLPHLRLGVREMDIYRDVVQRATKPSTEDSGALFQYHSDRLVAAAITQTFDYMLESGLEYSYITTGEAYVFLKIDWSNPITLLYHLAEPKEEVKAHPENVPYCTAVSQVLAFSLLALRSQPQHQDVRRDLIKTLYTWDEDWESILRSIPETERKETSPPASAFRPRNYIQIDRSPYHLRQRNIASRSGGCAAPESSARRDDDEPTEPSDDDSPSRDKHLRSRGSQTTGNVSTQNAGTPANRAGRNNQQRRDQNYCTQKCLLGLVLRSRLDPSCPNVSLHCVVGNCDHNHLHPLDHGTWLAHVQEQLGQTLDSGCNPVGKQGARGALFKVSLISYGYTFIGKGTVQVFIPDLQHEASIYRHLQTLQGSSIPVCLGAVDLINPYYYDVGVRIVHMLFQSWGGQCLDKQHAGQRATQDFGKELIRSLHAVHDEGVLHGDICPANMLWNPEAKRVMLIDFERSTFVSPRTPLSSLAFNSGEKRKVNVGKEERATTGEGFKTEISTAKFMFPC